MNSHRNLYPPYTPYGYPHLTSPTWIRTSIRVAHTSALQPLSPLPNSVIQVHCCTLPPPAYSHTPDDNPYPPPPPTDPNPNLYSHPHNLAPQFSHSGPLLYPPSAYSHTPYDNPYPPPPPTDPNPNLYSHPQPFSFFHIGSGQYDSPKLQPDLNQSSSSFHHTRSNQYDMHNHLSYSPSTCSASISSIHDGLAYMHITDSQPEHPPPVATSLPHHQRYDSFNSYSNSLISAQLASLFFGSQN